MTDATQHAPGAHSHVFLGETHQTSEHKTWAVIWLCGAMMIIDFCGPRMRRFSSNRSPIAPS